MKASKSEADYVHRTYGTGYAVDLNGKQRALTEAERAVYDKHLKASLAQCKEFQK